MDSQERFENVVGLVEAHQYEWAIWQAAERQEPVYDTSVVKRIATQMGWTPPSAQSGWKLVPHEPTKEMREAGREQWHRIGTTTDAWQAMFCAAPTPERAQESAGVHAQDTVCRGSHVWCNGIRYCLGSPSCAEILAANKEPQP